MVAQRRPKVAKRPLDIPALPETLSEVAGEDETPEGPSERLPLAAAAMVASDLAEQLAEIFRALSDPTRVRLVSALSVGELAVWELTELLGLTQAAVSHQLRFLRFLKLVKARKVGKSTLYSLCDRHVMSLFAEAHEHVIEGVEER